MRYSSIFFAVVLVGLVKVGFSQDIKPSHHGPVFTGDDEPSHYGYLRNEGGSYRKPKWPHLGYPMDTYEHTGDYDIKPLVKPPLPRHPPDEFAEDYDEIYPLIKPPGTFHRHHKTRHPGENNFKDFDFFPLTKPRHPPHKHHYRADEFIDDSNDRSIISNEDEFSSQDNTYDDLSDDSLEYSNEFTGDVFEFFKSPQKSRVIKGGVKYPPKSYFVG